MECLAKEGERPVVEILIGPIEFLSTTGHVKPGGNLAGPSAKAKYYPMTDSELVP